MRDKNVKEEDYEREVYDEYRTRRRLSIIPIITVRGWDGDYHWSGKWFGFVTIKEQKVRERYTGFDDGWSYQSYWKPWKEAWYFVEVLEEK